MKKFLSLLDKNKRFFLLTLLVGIVYSAISVAIPTISGRLITSVVADSANRTRLLCIFLLVSLFQLCFAELDEYMGNTLKIRQKKQMRRNAFHAFSAQDSAKREDISAFVSFVNNDIPSVAEQYVLGTIDMIKCMSILAFSALSLLYIHWVLALVIVGVSLLIVALPNTVRKRGGAARKRYSGVLANYNTTLRSILDGLRLVKAYRCRKYAAESVDSADDGDCTQRNDLAEISAGHAGNHDRAAGCKNSPDPADRPLSDLQKGDRCRQPCRGDPAGRGDQRPDRGSGVPAAWAE